VYNINNQAFVSLLQRLSIVKYELRMDISGDASSIHILVVVIASNGTQKENVHVRISCFVDCCHKISTDSLQLSEGRVIPLVAPEHTWVPRELARLDPQGQHKRNM